MKSSSNDPLDKAFAHERGCLSSQPVAAFTRLGHVGRGAGVMRSTMALGLVVWASTQAFSAPSPSASMNCSSPPREWSPLVAQGCRSSSA